MLKPTSPLSAVVVLSLSLVALAGCRLSGNVQFRAHGTGAVKATPPPPIDEDPALGLEDDPRIGQPVLPSVPWLVPSPESTSEPRQPAPSSPSPPSSPTRERESMPKRCEPLPAQYACAGAPGFCPEWECRDGEWVDVRRERPWGRPEDRGF
jgi:hypothetical protein